MRGLLVLLVVACSHPPAPYTGERPNFVFVLTDDLDVGVYRQMPRLAKVMDAQGTSFSNAFVTISLCCPSRATILRGQYAHNTHIYTNAPRHGGFEVFYALGNENDTIATWLQQAGYRTVLYGKYLNGYPATAPEQYVPPGWSEWYAPAAGTPYDEYAYTLNENGTLVDYGKEPQDYMIDVFATKSSDFIDRAAADGVPFFLYMSTFAPHTPATAAARYNADFREATAPHGVAWDERDMTDKPSWLRFRDWLDERTLINIDSLYRQRLKSMEAVEDLVQGLVDTLTRDGLLDKTYIIFTSDNGFHQGQHRLPSGKDTEFDEDLFVPLIVRGPDVAAGLVDDHPIVNVDYAPTILDLAHVGIPDSVDGRSFAPLLAGEVPKQWRTTVFLEHTLELPSNDLGRDVSTAPPGTLEPPDTYSSTLQYPPPFRGIRTDRYTYIEYGTGEQELYDHALDPWQLQNAITTTDQATIDQLSNVMHNFHGCTGRECRAAEEADVPAGPPAGRL